ncbi:MAG TPA: protein kinase [Pyrinomonadaceae bacterium]|nr:protein kinase [Pyrinomonadaceae bacterium]
MSESISRNTIIGQYSIVSLLGEGGMGEVYRARDTKLGRDVAIKVLPAAFSADAERLRRFEQEAQAAGALNHPNILVIFHIGTHDGAPYIVSELLEGETLRERMAGVALPQRKAIDYALQIAHGLAAAHAKGIVHRDLKPENLFVTNDGRVKILDFGLAKLTGTGDGNQSQTEIPTRKVNTDPGVVMGTMGYMSPEQLKGQQADHRSDLFSFGAILYEMLSGQRAFRSDSMAETMSAILREDPPDLSESNKTVSPALERVVRHCLEKSPEERFHSARDLAFAIESLSGTTTSSGQTVTIATLPAFRPHTRERLGWIVASVLLLALLTAIPFIVSYFRRAPSEMSVVRFSVFPPEKTSFDSFAVSPDGHRLAFTAAAEGKRELWVRPLGSLAAQALPGTEDARNPFWSPDSRYIGFFAGGKLKKIEATGGSAITVCDVLLESRGGAWSRDGVIVFAPQVRGSLYQVSANGGAPTPVTTLDESHQESTHRWPCFLPDGRHFIYFAGSLQSEGRAVYLGSLDGKETKRLLSADASAEYATSAEGGYLIFEHERKLMAQPFDASRFQIIGEPFPIADQVSGAGLGQSHSDVSVSASGVLSYRSDGGSTAQLAWFDRAGKSLGTVGPPGEYSFFALSPDEKRVALTRIDPQTGTSDIWVVDLSQGAPVRLTFDPANDDGPVWSPDGSRIVFDSNRAGHYDFYQKLASGGGNDEALLQSSDWKFAPDWSSDGRYIVYVVNDPKNRGDLWILPLFGERKPMPFLQTKFFERGAKFSPDVRWIAYHSDESGKYEVYVQSFPPSGGKWQISPGGGTNPQWRRDGKEIYYWAGNRLMAVEVKAGASFESGVSRALFEARVPGSFGLDYAVTHDGQRFLITNPVAGAAATPITVVINWMADLKK